MHERFPPADSPDDLPALPGNTADPGRRSFVSKLTSGAMLAGLASGYGTFGALAARYLYPARPPTRRWMFVAEVRRMPVGSALTYRAPDGRPIAVTRLRDQETAAAFVALSSTCPHLGCQVHWESQNDRFFCPCHNGAFNDQGIATAGPPFVARQNLAQFPLLVENGLLFIEVELPT